MFILSRLDSVPPESFQNQIRELVIHNVGDLSSVAIAVGDGGIGGDARRGWVHFGAVFQAVTVGIGGFWIQVRVCDLTQVIFLEVAQAVAIEVAGACTGSRASETAMRCPALEPIMQS